MTIVINAGKENPLKALLLLVAIEKEMQNANVFLLRVPSEDHFSWLSGLVKLYLP